MKKEILQQLDAQIQDASLSAAFIDPKLVTGYRSLYNRFFKRLIDFVLALILTVVLSPIIIAIALAVAIDSGFPVFYRAPRGGLHGKSFRIFKFRSMVKNADRMGGGTTALRDKRITRIGSFLRKTKLDEFANILSILKGDMSFIGPRPELLKYTNQYTGAEKLIEEVRPGITDYSSLEFINLDEIVGSENADEMFEKHVLPQKNKLRIKYAATVSFRTDAKLFFLTIYKVFQKSAKTLASTSH